MSTTVPIMMVSFLSWGFLATCVVLITLIAAPVLLILGLAKILTGSVRSGSLATKDEARTIQEIHDGLSRMEDRIAALETILIERAGSRPAGKDGKGAD